MERLYHVSSQMRTFLWISSIGKRNELRANGVALIDGCLVFQDHHGVPTLTLAQGAWLSVSRK